MTPQKPLVDFDYLAHVCQQDTTFMKEMIEAFIESIPLYSSELKIAFERDQKVQIGEVAHKLKPLLLYLKLDSLYQEIKWLQNASLQERLAGNGQQKMIETFETLQMVLAELKSFMATHP